MFWIVAALIVLSGVAVLLRWQGGREREDGPAGERTAADLRLGDTLRHLGTAYEVVGAAVLNEGGFRWRELRLSDGEQRRWLRVETSGVLRLTLFEEAEPFPVPGEPPASLVHEGQSFRLDERGRAYLTRYGDIEVRSGERVAYFHYVGPEGRRLSVEQIGAAGDMVARWGQELTGEHLVIE